MPHTFCSSGEFALFNTGLMIFVRGPGSLLPGTPLRRKSQNMMGRLDRGRRTRRGWHHRGRW